MDRSTNITFIERVATYFVLFRNRIVTDDTKYLLVLLLLVATANANPSLLLENLFSSFFLVRQSLEQSHGAQSAGH